MEHSERTFLPAAGHDWFLPLYDPFSKLIGSDAAREALLEQAALQPGHRVLDIGCGTGTLVALIKRRYPQVEVVGLDPDPKALARAQRKAERAGVSIQFDQGFSDSLPYPGASFDRVFSSLMLHHLRSEEKQKMLVEVRRVLKPGGKLHLVDFGGPDSGRGGFLAHLLHSSHRLKDNAVHRILARLNQAGFADAKKTGDHSLLLGHLVYYQASASASQAAAAASE